MAAKFPAMALIPAAAVEAPMAKGNVTADIAVTTAWAAIAMLTVLKDRCLVAQVCKRN